jgi:phosphohistidine phosphatase
MALELYLIRHGEAEERGDDYPDDTKRPLTRKGMAKLRKQARALNALGIGFDRNLTSPLVRTRQTAEILAQGLKPTPPLESIAALAPEGAPAAVIDAVGQHAKKGRVALVGHEPNLGELAAHLVGAGAPIPFKKGAICRIDFEKFPPVEAGELKWFVTPKMLIETA